MRLPRTIRPALAALVLAVPLLVPVTVAAPAHAATDWNLPEATIYELYSPALKDTMYSVISNEASNQGYSWTGRTVKVWLPRAGQPIDPAPAGLRTLWRLRIGSLHAMTVGTRSYPGAEFEVPFGYLANSLTDGEVNSSNSCSGVTRKDLHQMNPTYRPDRGYFTEYYYRASLGWSGYGTERLGVSAC